MLTFELVKEMEKDVFSLVTRTKVTSEFICGGIQLSCKTCFDQQQHFSGSVSLVRLFNSQSC